MRWHRLLGSFRCFDRSSGFDRAIILRWRLRRIVGDLLDNRVNRVTFQPLGALVRAGRAFDQMLDGAISPECFTKGLSTP